MCIRGTLFLKWQIYVYFLKNLDILTVCALEMHLQFYLVILSNNTVVQYVTSLDKWCCDSRERSNSITKNISLNMILIYLHIKNNNNWIFFNSLLPLKSTWDTFHQYVLLLLDNRWSNTSILFNKTSTHHNQCIPKPLTIQALFWHCVLYWPRVISRGSIAVQISYSYLFKFCIQILGYDICRQQIIVSPTIYTVAAAVTATIWNII